MNQAIKLFYFLGIAFTLSLNACAQTETNVPEKVEQAFKEKYASASNTTWERDRNNFYEARFELNGKKYRADFDKNATWIETERSITVDELPAAIKSALDRDYPGNKIVEVEEVDSSTKGKFYDVELMVNGK